MELWKLTCQVVVSKHISAAGRLQRSRFAPVIAGSPKICLDIVQIKINFWENSTVFKKLWLEYDRKKKSVSIHKTLYLFSNGCTWFATIKLLTTTEICNVGCNVAIVLSTCKVGCTVRVISVAVTFIRVAIIGRDINFLLTQFRHVKRDQLWSNTFLIQTSGP